MEKAKKKRMSARSWLTKTCAKLEGLLEQDDLTLEELAEQISELEKRLSNLDENQDSVEAYLPQEELEADIESAATFRDQKTDVLMKAKRRYKMFINETEDRPCLENERNVNDRSIKSRPSTRLPKLELPKFSGDYTQWQTFWDKFSAVIDRSELPVVSKFTYLQSLLQEEASSAIAGLALTSENYVTAKDILCQRFGRKERIIFSHIQKLLQTNISVTKDPSSASGTSTSLSRLHDDIQTNVRSLQNLGVGGETYGVILTPLILHQMPANIRLEWARIGEGHEGDLEFLLKFMYKEIRRRARSQTFSSGVSSAPSMAGGKQSKISHTKTPPNKKTFGSAAALLSGQSHSKGPHCVFCTNTHSHYSDQCDKIKELDFESRRDKIKKLGLCFLCLGKHFAKDCKRVCYHCKGHHHSVLCKLHIPKEARNETNLSHVGISYSKSDDMTTVMQVVGTRINGVKVNIMFDSGSDKSFITTSCANKLNLDVVGKESLNYCCFGDSEVRKGEKDVYELNTFGERIRLISMKTICSSMYRAPIPLDVLRHFSSLSFKEDFSKGREVKIDILIGLDWYWPLIKNQKISSSVGLVAQETVFGWMLSGVYSYRKEGWERQVKHDSCTTNGKSQILFCRTGLSDKEVRKLWELDSIGIEQTKEENKNTMDEFLSSFKKEIQFSEGRYVVKLPWKSELDKSSLMDNREQAEKRLDNLRRRLAKDDELKKNYDAVFIEFEKNAIIEEIPEKEMKSDHPVFYLPHRPVVRNESLTTKVRLVFDASCRGVNGVSLNDCMTTGPNLIPDLIQILLRFRRWRFGLNADISKAFLQIEVHKPDQDAHRFLWDINNQTKTMRFKRVIFGNACSPFLLNATLKFHLSKYQSNRTVKELENNLYVDDWLTGADTEEDIIQMKHEAEEILKQGGFPFDKMVN